MTTSQRQTTLETVVVAYIQCALWSSTGEDDEPLDSFYESWDLAEEASASVVEDCENFLAQLEELKIDWTKGWTAEQFGHDFWLTRNGHGAGFWDRYYDNGEAEELGNTLTQLCKPYGESDLYVGDDGKLYITP